MKKPFVLAIIALFTASALCAEAQYFDLKTAFETPRFKKKLRQDIEFSFGSGSQATIIKEGLKTHQKAKGAAKNPEKACQEALLKTLIRFQKRAQKMGAPKVVNLVGNYYDQSFDDKDKFQCWVAGNVAGVLYLGDIAQ